MRASMLWLPALCLWAGSCTSSGDARDASGRFTVEAAHRWYERQGTVAGCNFIPSTAVNELEMWQAATFDPVTIDRELGYAENVGFNVVRVFLHDKLWQQDPTGFLDRIDRFLDIADSHGIRVLFVLFDNVWNPTSTLGPQPDPIPGVHNSRWVQSPERAETVAFPDDAALRARLEAYVEGVVGAFADDPRVFMWDVLNEPGNSGIGGAAIPLLEATFAWARSLRPQQPLTAGPWLLHTVANYSTVALDLSDVVTFHQYSDAAGLEELLVDLEANTDRPMICTEFMARTYGSTFTSNVPVFDAHHVGFLSWGLVSGRTQTIYPWLSPQGAPEPTVWFHDLFRADGTPFDPAEIDFLRAHAGLP